MIDVLDQDIAIMNLSESEKWGLQVYRNYSRAFGEHRVKIFVEQASPFEAEVMLFKQVIDLVISEELRVLPVIAASYADERLEEMFKREIPEGVPGGRGSLISGFGPLARFSQRIQMAFAFGWMSKDLLVEFDQIRRIRNEISHKWDVDLLKKRMSELIEHKQVQFEAGLGDGVRLPKGFHENLMPTDRFRVRLVWLLGRLTYEARLWVPALKAGVAPEEALYGNNSPLMLREIASVSVGATRMIARI